MRHFVKGVFFYFPLGWGMGATSSRKEEKRLKAFFRINVPARDGRLRGPVAVLLGISTTKGDTPLDTPYVWVTRPLGLGQTAVFMRQTAWK